MRIDCRVKHGNDKKEEGVGMAKNKCGNDIFVSIEMTKKASAIIAVFTYWPPVFRKL